MKQVCKKQKKLNLAIHLILGKVKPCYSYSSKKLSFLIKFTDQRTYSSYSALNFYPNSEGSKAYDSIFLHSFHI